MKGFSNSVVVAALLAASPIEASPSPVEHAKKDVYTNYPYVGPAVPVGDFVDPTINGNGKGFPRLVEAPAVKPASKKPKNNINVVSLAYIPNGINIHYQTPFGLGEAPTITWGTNPRHLRKKATGVTTSYDRTPPCSEVVVTQCSQFFHDVQLNHLRPGTTYYYKIAAANGTTASDVLSFKTAPHPGDTSAFTVAVLADMGYTNAHGTHKYLLEAAQEELAFAWHGGDLSYADDWYSGILPCEDDWPVCYNGTSTELPGGPPIPPEYLVPLPAGEIANQGGPQGGDMSVLYESNWDLWQQWMQPIWSKIPYMVLPGNHDNTCAEFDGPNNELTAYLVDNKPNSTAPESELTYYACPPSQRNFTTFHHRFRMPGAESKGVDNMWYSFDYGMTHFISIDTETDFAFSPSWPFIRDTKGAPTLPLENQTYVTDAGPFGYITGGNYTSNTAYEQYNWLKADLAAVDRSKTPWVVAMGHRPMWSSEVSGYQKNLRNAFYELMVDGGVDAYMAGHIHWYERPWPLTINGTNSTGAIINPNTYRSDTGKTLITLVNGMAGNVESHSTLDGSPELYNVTAVLDQKNFGFCKLKFHNATTATYTFIHGADGTIGDELTIIRNDTTKGSGYGGHGGYGGGQGSWGSW